MDVRTHELNLTTTPLEQSKGVRFAPLPPGGGALLLSMRPGKVASIHTIDYHCALLARPLSLRRHHEELPCYVGSIVIALLASLLVAGSAVAAPYRVPSQQTPGWYGLFVIGVDGAARTAITFVRGAGPDSLGSWSLDGRQIVYEQTHGHGSNIILLNLDGSGYAILPITGNHPTWAPR